MDTERLLGKVAQGDEEALAALYDQTLNRLWGVTMRMVADPEAAQEIVSDSYLQIWNQAGRFDPSRGSGIGWMLMIARSRAIDHLRRERGWRQHQALDTVDENPRMSASTSTDDTRDDPESLLASLQSATALHHALATLDNRAHRLLGLAFFNGMTHAEIASHTGEPLGTIKSCIRRTQLQLREILRRH
ncbi:sigma-70 family RNA polymerase sigma factor [Thioalkalivibrio paradoxus]|uniref:RNA polymerase sigma factor n=1 Tax=Thioalkalivibrio paradoxus ARh 1 TaxID=713585 RepID=W0DMI1_9GAMM|nr:sigma-70 family RNA polymerase sigma factor [Thioalkalivibrio paradoxus]AHE98178.1 RNA polymerase sigma factor [Thioalkalivibrio paradoxus ARh 1]